MSIETDARRPGLFESKDDAFKVFVPGKRCVFVSRVYTAGIDAIKALKPSWLRFVDWEWSGTEQHVIRETSFRAMQFIPNESLDLVWCADIVSPAEVASWWHKLAFGGALIAHAEALAELRSGLGGRKADIAIAEQWLRGLVKHWGSELTVLEDCDLAIIRGDASASSWVFQLRRLDVDRAMLDRIAPYIKPGALALDIGAHIGTHTCDYLKRAAGVVAFEPNPTAAACLRYNCSAATVHQCALGDHEVEKYWTSIFPNAGGSFLADVPSPGCVAVPVRPLDSFGLKNIGYAKIDAEGMECEVLRGGQETILRDRPAMCLEVNMAAMERYGASRDVLYALLSKYGYNIEPIWPGADSEPQYDIIAVPH